MKRGHLERRGCRGRTIAWARVPVMAGGQVIGIDYRLFVRVSATGASLMESRAFSLAELHGLGDQARRCIARELRARRAQLKWRRDQLDRQLLGQTGPLVLERSQPVFCGVCGQAIRHDPWTGTRCACAQGAP